MTAMALSWPKLTWTLRAIPAAVDLEPDRTLVDANGESLSVVSVSIRDLIGRVVPTATNLVHFAIQGPGKIIGVGNGDPGCHEPDKYLSPSDWQRSAFNGYAQSESSNPRKSPAGNYFDGEHRRLCNARDSGLYPIAILYAAPKRPIRIF